MSELFSFPSSMLWPLAACLVLTGIHVYLGVHVIARKVIFVDLALAQIAALGTVIGTLLGYEVGKDATALYLYSLAFTIFGAFVFSVTKMRGERVPHEAIIGIVYAVTFAATILILARSALGPQELDHIIKGELLWVQGPTVIKTAIIYACVGVFHFIFRRQFMALSFGEGNGLTNHRFWDFLFYMSFGFVITSSVAIAGVFLVFSYLVIPSVGAMLFTDKLGKRLLIGWIGGAIISVVGVKLSYETGLPTSPLVVVLFAGLLILSAIVRAFMVAQRRIIVLRNLLLGTAVIAVFVTVAWMMRKPTEDPLEHAMHLLASPISTERLSAVKQLQQFPDRAVEWKGPVRQTLHDEDAEVRQAALEVMMATGDRSMLVEIVGLVKDPSDRVRSAAIGALQRLGGVTEGDRLTDLASAEADPEIQIDILRAAAELGSVQSIDVLSRLSAEGGIFASDAVDILRHHIDVRPVPVTGDAVRAWIRANRDRLEWDPATHLFRLGEPGLRKRGHE